MSNHYVRHFHQQITFWPTSESSYTGFTFGDPVVLLGRWEDKAEMFRSPGGEEFVSKSIAYLPQDVEIGDYLALGNLSSVVDPTTVAEAFRVRLFSKIPDLRNICIDRKAVL